MPPPDPSDESPVAPPAPSSAAGELLLQAREKAVKLLNQLLAEQAEVEWSPSNPTDPQAAADWRQAMICAIDSARRALAAIDAALKIAPADEPPAKGSTGSDDAAHRWN